MKKSRLIPLTLLILFIGIQFFKPEENNTVERSPNDFRTVVKVPQPVLAKLQTACFNCHSNHTRYPWYAHVAPVSWWIAGHITAGKEHLNFSEFATYTRKRQMHKLEKIAEAVEKGWMPLKSYKIMHAECLLKKEEVQEISDWVKSAQANLQSQS